MIHRMRHASTKIRMLISVNSCILITYSLVLLFIFVFIKIDIDIYMNICISNFR